MQNQEGIDQFALFAVVLTTKGAPNPVMLQSARDSDEATIAFHLERQRLLQDRMMGELQLVHHGEGGRTLLREPLP